jgi:SAM-dependent methyltransferase
VFSEKSAFFGEDPSEFAKNSVELFRREDARTILEMGAGQGRDTLFFARRGLRVTALDYAETGTAAIQERAAAAGLSPLITARTHDVRQPLPFPAGSFDGCYSHMLLCMELSTAEIAFILGEIHRVLRPGGLALYSVRSNFDKHWRTGTHVREDIYEIGGFAVHFFTEEKVRKLAAGYEVLEIDRMEEGSLPRDLFRVTLRKTSGPAGAEVENDEMSGSAQPEEPVPDPGRT